MANMFDRRSVLLGMMGLPIAGAAFAAENETLPAMHVYKDASCGCCGGWMDHIRQAGFAVTGENMPDMEAVKERFNVPENLYSCHTALVGGYVVEGHVPAAAVRRMLTEKPAIVGLSAPGMPVGSPGMETPDGHKEPYEVVAFGKDGSQLYARFLGDKEI